VKRWFGVWIAVGLFSLPARAATLRIYHIDVEQADATLFIAPGGKALLVDSGKDGMGSRIKAVMEAAGLARVDYFVCTHYHEDHYGGIDELVALDTPVLETYDRGDKLYLPASKLAETAYTNYLDSVGEDARHITRGMTIPLDPQMTVTCISSGGVVIGEANPRHGVDENDMSVSLLLSYGSFRYFIGGDIEAPTEAKIAAGDLVRNVSVYHSNHHGSDTSSSRAFIEDLEPGVIIISNGNNGTYKHPRQTVLDAYETLPGPPKVFQTNKYLKGGAGGNVADEFIADPESADLDGTILITVDLAGGEYRVSYGAGAEHEFALPGSAPGATVVIASLLPNPAGSDEEGERVVLANKGDAPVFLAGWWLEDRAGLRWELGGSITLQAGATRTIERNGRPMSLSNTGDDITLFDAAGAMRDRFEYDESSEGVAITTGH